MKHADKPKIHGKRKPVFHYRLWMLFLLFIPAAIYAKRIGDVPSLAYMESKSLFWRNGYEQILFSEMPDGTPVRIKANIDSAYECLGVSFSHGTPDRLERLKILKPPLAQPVIKTDSGRLIESEHDSSASPSQVAASGPGNNGSYIGISGFEFRVPPNDQFIKSVCCHDAGKSTRRFKGTMTIWFHQPDLPDADAGVHRVGFYAARLDATETLRVKLYATSGELIGFQSNLSSGTVFMGFESKFTIGWVEIETIGKDRTYAIGNLVFDRVR